MSSRVPVSWKRTERKIIIDKREFDPCQGKEIEEWSWKKAKNEKYIIHLDKEGIITRTKLTE